MTPSDSSKKKKNDLNTSNKKDKQFHEEYREMSAECFNSDVSECCCMFYEGSEGKISLQKVLMWPVLT